MILMLKINYVQGYLFINNLIVQMLSRLFHRSLLYFSGLKDTPDLLEKGSIMPTSRQEYLLVPTEYAVSPYYLYSSTINKHFYDYIQKNKIRSVVAFPIRPGVFRHKFYPQSIEHLEKEFQLQTVPSTEKATKANQSLTINSNNMIYDGAANNLEEVPVKYINSVDQIYPIGSVCSLSLMSEQGNYFLYLKGQIRLEISPSDYEKHEGPLVYLKGKSIKADMMTVLTKDYEHLLSLYSKIKSYSTVNLPDIDTNDKSVPIKVAEMMTNYLCCLSYFSKDQLYEIFKTTEIHEKIKLLIKAYEKYIQILEEDWKKMMAAQGRIQQRRKEAVVAVFENVKRIIGNVGEQRFIDKIKKKLRERPYPQHIQKLIESQLSNLEMEGNHDVSRKKHYITLLTEYPFGILAKQEFDINKAKKILAEDHYGMEKLKKRILEFIAVSKLKGQFKSKVLLLHGPPGVGKTSIVKSIAKCLNRPYGRISLGGEYDTSIIKGHRKTYVGAYPGKIFDVIYKSKVENPVILLDQIDKVMNRAGGASLQDSIMQVLDPIQNHKFKDDFMDVEIDLSRVLFICTANTLDTIFPPLLDRLERIEVSGYTTHEKEEIFKRYIIGDSMKQNGFSEQQQKQIDFSQEALNNLIQGYCKQAGVRNLVRKTNKIFQKIAYEIVKNTDFTKSIKRQHLIKYLGLPTFHEARWFAGIPPRGVMIGLAYNNYGGSIMYIESAVANSGKKDQKQKSEKKQGESKQGSLIVTGNIHDVMKESCQLAYSYAKYVLSTFFNSHFLEENDIHLNFPEIEIGKDGPSAGVAITCTLISLALNKPAFRQIAMTGEITLSGAVNPIGGVKEKTMGAKREGISTLIFPEDNRKDVEQLQAQIKEGMTFYFAKHYFEVLDLVFGIKVDLIQQSTASALA